MFLKSLDDLELQRETAQSLGALLKSARDIMRDKGKLAGRRLFHAL
jgi:hypothetical protein